MVKRSGRRHLIFIFAAFALLMGSIDSTIVAVAVSNLNTALNAPMTSVGWTLTAYLLVQIVMLPLIGSFSDRVGRKRIFLLCLAIFTLGSLLCGLASSIGWLIAFRALQAVGGGGLMPSAVGIVADQYPKQRAQAIGLFTSVAPIGAIVGPNLGGFILDHATWRELFFINVPVGVLVLVAIGLLLRDKHVHAVGQRVSGLRALIDPNLLIKPPYVVANLYSLVFGAVTFGFFSFIPYYAVARYGLSAFESGAVLTPRALAMIATSAVASLLIARTGYRRPMLVGMGLVILTLVLLSQGWLTANVGGLTLGGFWLMALILLLGGIGVGLVSPAASNAVLDLAPLNAAALTGIRTMFSLAGGALSVSAIMLVLSVSPDAALGLEFVFQVLAGVMLVAVGLACLIPERGAVNAAQPAPRPIRVIKPRPALDIWQRQLELSRLAA